MRACRRRSPGQWRGDRRGGRATYRPSDGRSVRRSGHKCQCPRARPGRRAAAGPEQLGRRRTRYDSIGKLSLQGSAHARKAASWSIDRACSRCRGDSIRPHPKAKLSQRITRVTQRLTHACARTAGPLPASPCCWHACNAMQRSTHMRTGYSLRTASLESILEQ